MPTQVTENIEVWLEELMKEKCYNIERLHNDTGISRTTISELLGGKAKDIRLKTIHKLCEAFDCEIGDLIQFKKQEEIK